MSLRLVLAVALGATGCLKIQEAVPRDAGPDADVFAGCGEPADFNPQPFPPPGAEISISVVEAADLNDDGVSDLVFLNTNVRPEDQGFFILLGPEDEQELKYHAFARTMSEPFALEVFQFEGSPCLDVSVFGTARDAPPTGIIEIWENVGADQMFADTNVTTKEVEFEPNSNSMHIEVGALGTDGIQNDIAVADNTNVVVFNLTGTDFSGLQAATPLNIAPDASTTPGQWTDIQGLAYETSKPIEDFDDLLVVERTDATWIRNMGDATFDMLGAGASGGVFDLGSLAVVDLDGNDTPDLIGGSDNDFGAYLLERTGSAANIVASEWTGGQIPNVANLDSIVVANLGEGAAPEVVVLDSDVVGESSATVIVDANIDMVMGTLGPSASRRLVLPDFDPGLGIYVDFDDNGVEELLVIETQTGAIECLQLGVDGLEVCN